MTPYRWKRKEVLDALFITIKSFKGEDEISAQLARYLCVLVAGFLETSTREILLDYAIAESNLHVSNFVSKKMERLKSPNMDNILELAGSFNKDWSKAIKEDAKGDLTVNINLLVTIRNKIAHGEDSDITFLSVSQYYDQVIEVIKILESHCCSSKAVP